MNSSEKKSDESVAMKWGDIGLAVERLKTFLKVSAAHNEKAPGKQNFWHTVFKMGSVVQDDTKASEFKGYEDSDYELPDHRIEQAYHKRFMDHNVATWSKQKDIFSDEPGKVLRRAYGALISDGYPYPGGEGSDRMAWPCEALDENKSKALLMTIWPHRSHQVLNLSMVNVGDEDVMLASAASIAGDLRRYDYISPEVYCLISPELEVFMPGDAKA